MEGVEDMTSPEEIAAGRKFTAEEIAKKKLEAKPTEPVEPTEPTEPEPEPTAPEPEPET